MNNNLETDPTKLRNLAAILTTISGISQCLSLWLLPTSPDLLLTAALGCMYLVLGLGLFGISSLSVVLALVLLPMRSWFALAPLDIETWEFLRVACDLAVAALCVPVIWASLDPGHRKIEPGHRQLAKDLGGPDIDA